MSSLLLIHTDRDDIYVRGRFLFLQRKKDHVKELFESRARAEDDAVGARTPHNRLHVSSLVALLEERRDMVIGTGGSSMTAAAVRQLAEKYGMDVERLERLVRSVNVPYVGEPPLGGGAGVGTVGFKDAESGEDIVVKEVSLLSFRRRGFPWVLTNVCNFFLCRWNGRSQRVLRDDGRHPTQEYSKRRFLLVWSPVIYAFASRCSISKRSANVC